MHKLTRGERFKGARLDYNQHGKQTMDEVTIATGISKSMIQSLEDDESQRSVGYDKVAILAKHYGVSADWLLGLWPDYHKEPCAAEELGLSPAAVERLRKQVALEHSDNLSGLSAIIEDSRMLYLAGEIERFRSMVSKRIRYAEANNYTSYLTGDSEVVEDHNSYKQDVIDDEQFGAHTLQQRIENLYPASKGKFNVIAGAQMIEYEKQHLVNVFEQILCRITCFDQYREGVDLEYLSQSHGTRVLDHEVE